MIKSISLLILLTVMSFLSVKGQDTLKRDTSTVKKEKPYKLFLHSLTKRRDVYLHQHHQQDSILRKRIPPEVHHPVIYVDGGFGYTFAGLRGLQGDYSLNYQYKRSLFTLRGLGTASYNYEPSGFYIFPSRETGSLSEYAFLYGWRLVTGYQQAFSFSAGIADDRRSVFSYSSKNIQTATRENYAGIPFQSNYQFYTRRFGASLGLKLLGDVSQHSFIGIGVDLGLGYHYAH